MGAVGYFHRKIQDRSGPWAEIRFSVVFFQVFNEGVVFGERTEILPVGFESVEALIFHRYHHRDHLALGS